MSDKIVTPAPSTPTPPPSKAEEKDAPKKDNFWKLLLFLIIGAWILRSLIVAPFSIPSGSMLPTMRIGDHLLVAKWPYGYSKNSFLFGVPPIEGRIFASQPKRGDIVVFRDPNGQGDLVKRVIGLPGDVVELRRGVPVINGEEATRVENGQSMIPVTPNSPCRTAPGVEELQQTVINGEVTCLIPRYTETLPNGVSYSVLDQGHIVRADDVEAINVLPGHYLFLGDNRDDSWDSRFGREIGGIGQIPAENLIGKALFIYWSTDGSASWINPISWFTAARWERFLDDYSGPRE